MHYDVYGIGNALVDIQANVSDDLLQQITRDVPSTTHDRLAKGTMHLVDTTTQGHILRLLEEIGTHTVSGGSAANTMIGVAHLGGRAAYAGKVGDDVYGAFYAEDLHKASVAYRVPFGHAETGTCIVLVTPDAQRTFFTHLGISTALTPNDIDEAAIKASQWVYIEGYLWDAPGPKAASLKAMELACHYGVKVAYSFSDPFCVRRARSDFRDFTERFVDLVFCNEEEALAFTDAGNVEDAIGTITALDTAVAITRGERGSLFAMNGTRHIVPPVHVDAIDSTGAGDLYAAGVLHGLCSGKTPAEAGELGSALAARILTVRGARLP
ncbi:MAG: adenosine kinase [Deltaproteobacteria bacterium]|nr:adenosine kinase [Deltaproteobacteria bacterium]